jgi:hypothetical protein
MLPLLQIVNECALAPVLGGANHPSGSRSTLASSVFLQMPPVSPVLRSCLAITSVPAEIAIMVRTLSL